MAYPADQTARLQDDIDNHLIREFLQSDALDLCNKLADSFLKLSPTDGELLSACNGLRLVGQGMNSGDIAPDDPDEAHDYIEGIYSYGGTGYTQFLTAYAACYRRWDTLNFAGTPFWQSVGDAFNQTLDDIGNKAKQAVSGAGDIFSGSLLSIFKGLWPILALVVVAIVAIVVIASVTKGKISIT